jgi:hypothetical protein
MIHIIADVFDLEVFRKFVFANVMHLVAATMICLIYNQLNERDRCMLTISTAVVYTIAVVFDLRALQRVALGVVVTEAMCVIYKQLIMNEGARPLVRPIVEGRDDGPVAPQRRHKHRGREREQCRRR